jgi:hypothetical protein
MRRLTYLFVNTVECVTSRDFCINYAPHQSPSRDNARADLTPETTRD